MLSSIMFQAKTVFVNLSRYNVHVSSGSLVTVHFSPGIGPLSCILLECDKLKACNSLDWNSLRQDCQMMLNCNMINWWKSVFPWNIILLNIIRERVKVVRSNSKICLMVLIMHVCCHVYMYLQLTSTIVCACSEWWYWTHSVSWSDCGKIQERLTLLFSCLLPLCSFSHTVSCCLPSSIMTGACGHWRRSSKGRVSCCNTRKKCTTMNQVSSLGEVDGGYGVYLWYGSAQG